uniref:Uncharacterized protein n=1 Tax=Caenorhabditis tropicalis TaxID=1561998 RepID=A0A1I7USC3_9PELO
MKTQALILLSLGFIAIYLNDDNHTEPSVSMEAVQTSQKPHNVDSSDIRFLALSISTPMRYSPGSGTHHRFSPPSAPQPNSPVTNGTHHRFSPPSSPQPNSPVTNGTHHRFSPPSSPQPNSPVTNGTHHRFSPPSSPQPNSPVTDGTHHRFSPPSSLQPNSPVTNQSEADEDARVDRTAPANPTWRTSKALDENRNRDIDHDKIIIDRCYMHTNEEREEMKRLVPWSPFRRSLEKLASNPVYIFGKRAELKKLFPMD